MILPPICAEIDTRREPRCRILDSVPRPTPNDSDGMSLIWTYGKTGGDAIQRMQKFVAMMLKDKQP